jgi:hypothetical protein
VCLFFDAFDLRRSLHQFLARIDRRDTGDKVAEILELQSQRTQLAVLLTVLTLLHLVDRAIQQWLDPPNASVKHVRVRKQRQKDTCQWFFDSKFRDWKESKSGVYWINGNRAHPLVSVSY